MKKKKALLIPAFICIIAVFAGACILLNEWFPQAGNIRLPEREAVISVSVGVNNEEAFEISNVDSAELLRLLSDKKPTRKQSLNDSPTSKPFYRIELRTSEVGHRYFIYEDNSEQIYIEMPYEGIYTAEEEIFSFVLKHFQA